MHDEPDDMRPVSTAPPSGTGCAECEDLGGWWVHLRRCAACGHIGCCDSSLGRHASGHYAATGHPLVQSFEPREDWFWDYRTQELVEGPELSPPRSHPEGQTSPGPRERVPADWRAVLRGRDIAEEAENAQR
ncbi:UBP-type zinc finger domain-containing protein [Microbacterium yannicii]|uniref:UBP-type zinc finger domain-containing protein n=1 Tax=Microbacterium yannicii TaxID=671622 RepID=UPI0002D497C4|nr:UBP-type zinc finger domain-containing protein [Microbacterium yannicii]